MSTINDYFIDSSILVEYNKGSKQKLFNNLLGNNYRCFVNEIVLSEFLFYFLAHNSTRSSQSLKEAGKISEPFLASEQYRIISLCQFLQNDKRLFFIVPELMSKYNLLSNDAIILATCKLHNIPNLASHDKDFANACKAEGIMLHQEI